MGWVAGHADGGADGDGDGEDVGEVPAGLGEGRAWVGGGRGGRERMGGW